MSAILKFANFEFQCYAKTGHPMDLYGIYFAIWDGKKDIAQYLSTVVL